MKLLQLLIIAACLATPAWPDELIPPPAYFAQPWVESTAGATAPPNDTPPAAKLIPANTSAVKTAVPSGLQSAYVISRSAPPVGSLVRSYDPRDYQTAVAVFTARSGWCPACNAMAASGFAERMAARTVVIRFDIDRPLPRGVRFSGPIPRILLYRNGARVGDWTGYSQSIQWQIEEAVK